MSAAQSNYTSNVSSTLDELVRVLPELARMFLGNHPILSFIIVLLSLGIVTWLITIPLVTYFANQQTKRHKNILDYKHSMKKMQMEYNLKKNSKTITPLTSKKGGEG